MKAALDIATITTIRPHPLAHLAAPDHLQRRFHARPLAAFLRDTTPREVTAPGWVCDWGRTPHTDKAVFSFARVTPPGLTDGPIHVAALSPLIDDGELVAVLATALHARHHGDHAPVIYTDSLPTASLCAQPDKLHGRDPGNAPELIRLLALFTTDQLARLDVRWVRRSSFPAHREVDRTNRHALRGTPTGNLAFDLDALLRQAAAEAEPGRAG